MKNYLKLFSMILSIMLISAVFIACAQDISNIGAENLMDEIKVEVVQGKEIDGKFLQSSADFTVELFKKSLHPHENSLVSPISVMFALAMTANGAGGNTLEQMENVLTKDLNIDELNEYLAYYMKHLPNDNKSKIEIANSIWFRDDEERLTVEKSFLQTNANYYGAEIYKSPFNDETLADINTWVMLKTDGVIDKILDIIEEDSVMFLINAIVFDAEWQKIYNKNDIREGQFLAYDKTKQTIDFMWSEESIYLDDGQSEGFIKPYINEKYSFAALLPNEGIAINDYIAGLTGERLLHTLKNADHATIYADMPKFSYDYEIKLNEILIAMGMSDAFSAQTADFTKMADSSRGNIYMGEVVHKTFISLDELGTKAGAVTKVDMKDGGAPMDIIYITLDRPFVYAIIDNSTMLPLFIGTVLNIH